LINNTREPKCFVLTATNRSMFASLELVVNPPNDPANSAVWNSAPASCASTPPHAGAPIVCATGNQTRKAREADAHVVRLMRRRLPAICYWFSRRISARTQKMARQLRSHLATSLPCTRNSRDSNGTTRLQARSQSKPRIFAMLALTEGTCLCCARNCSRSLR
jgi:hypothetical protein